MDLRAPLIFSSFPGAVLLQHGLEPHLSSEGHGCFLYILLQQGNLMELANVAFKYIMSL